MNKHPWIAMKELYLALVLVTPVISGTIAASPQEPATAVNSIPAIELRYVDSPYGWPYSFQNGKQLSGTFPQLMRLISQDLQLNISTLMAPDVRTLEQINKHHADVTTIVTYQSPVGSSLKVEDYPDFIHVCATPLINGTMALISTNSIPEMEEQNPTIPINLTIGVLRLSNTGSFLDKPFNSPHKILQFNSNALMLKSFIAGRLDAFIGDPNINISWVNYLAKKELPVNEYPIGDYQIRFAISNNWRGGHKKIHNLCEVINQYSNNGTIKSILASVIKKNPPSY